MSVNLKIVTVAGYRVSETDFDYVYDVWSELEDEALLAGISIVDDPMCGEYLFIGQEISSGSAEADDIEIQSCECPNISPNHIAETITEYFPVLDVTPSEIRLYTVPVFH